MLRVFLSVLAGLVVGVISITLLQMVGHLIYTPPSITDSASYKVYFDTAPAGALLMVVLAHAMGTLVGGVAALKVSKGTQLAGVIVGIFFVLATVTDLVNMLIKNITPPIWFTILDPLCVIMATYALYKYVHLVVSSPKNSSK
ncbi:hypothetical protein N9R81_02805 [Flavobacteriales bacterium]|nr:hypothetical protein [Flavobacteriales bacterium]